MKCKNIMLIVSIMVDIYFGILCVCICLYLWVRMEMVVVLLYRLLIMFEIKVFDLWKIYCFSRQDKQEIFDMIIVVS